ncbi:MAG: FHA domain-containing protein, partial [Myxococcales bacterium]|nr:FHA domain-containing protein [Myxococcales bacterium]
MLPQRSRDKTSIDEDASTVLLRKRKRKHSSSMRRLSPFTVVVVDGQHRGELLPLWIGDNVVGRSLEAAVSLTDEGISRRHAILAVDAQNRVTLLDIDSTNGTTLNGKRVSATRVRAGDRIGVGRDVTLELRVGSRGSLDPGGSRGESDIPVPRGRPKQKAAGGGLSNKLLALEPTSSDGEPCWGYSEGALSAYERLLRIRETKLGDEHSGVAEILDVLGRALQDGDQLDRALSCFRRAESIYRAQTPPASESAAYSIVRQAQCELGLGRHEAALAAYRRAEALLVDAGAGEYVVAGVRVAIARMLWTMKRDQEEALRLAREAHSVFSGGGTALSGFLREAAQCITVLERALQGPRAMASAAAR